MAVTMQLRFRTMTTWWMQECPITRSSAIAGLPDLCKEAVGISPFPLDLISGAIYWSLARDSLGTIPASDTTRDPSQPESVVFFLFRARSTLVTLLSGSALTQ